MIDAIKYKAPSYLNIRNFIESFGDDPKKILIKVWDDPNEKNNISNISGTSHLAIRTFEGEIKISSGDWIIRGVQGEYYTCKDDPFNKR